MSNYQGPDDVETAPLSSTLSYSKVNGNSQAAHGEVAIHAIEPHAPEGRTKLWYSLACGSCTVMLLLGSCFLILSAFIGPLFSKRERHPVSRDEVSFNCNREDWSETMGWSDLKQAYCCETRGISCGTEGTKKVLAERPSGFDCDRDFQSWQQSWSSEKQSWCCEKQQRGCTNSSPEVVADSSDSSGCETPCTFQGKTFRCKSRIQYTATHQLADHMDACGKALAQVRGDCPVCSGCSSIIQAGCK